MAFVAPFMLIAFRTATADDFASTGSGGALVIVGGGSISNEIKARFVELGGGPKAKIVVIPTASIDADKSEKRDGYLNQWRSLNPASLELIHTRDRKQADDAGFAKAIREATAVWFSGGDQNRIIDAYLGTLVEKELHKLLERGGVIGGTSAGAAIMSDLMIQGGRDAGVLTGPGFGFLKGIVVDQHFSERKRIGRLRHVLSVHPQYAGIGIDEGTAVVVRNGRVEVLGAAGATSIDAVAAPHSKREQRLLKGSKVLLVELLPLRKAA